MTTHFDRHVLYPNPTETASVRSRWDSTYNPFAAGRVMKMTAVPCPAYAFISAVAAWATVICGCEGVPESGRQLLIRACRDYERGDLKAAEHAAREFIRDHPFSPAAAEALYLRGLCRTRLNRRALAKADFAAAAAKAARNDLKAYCAAMLGNFACEDGDAERAVSHYAEAAPVLPVRPPGDDILFRYGSCLQRVGRWKDSRLIFSRLLHEYPNSRRVPDARRRFAWPYDAFAIQCGAFDRLDEAHHAAAEWTRRGLNVTVEFIDLEGRGRWRALEGRYETYAKAIAGLPAVQRIVPEAAVVP